MTKTMGSLSKPVPDWTVRLTDIHSPDWCWAVYRDGKRVGRWDGKGMLMDAMRVLREGPAVERERMLSRMRELDDG